MLSSQVTKKTNLKRTHSCWLTHAGIQMIGPTTTVPLWCLLSSSWDFGQRETFTCVTWATGVCLQPFHLSSLSVIILPWTNRSIQAPLWLCCCPPTSIPPTGERSMGTFSVAWHFESRGTMNRMKHNIEADFKECDNERSIFSDL